MISSGVLVAVVVTILVFILKYCQSQLSKYRDINKLPGPGVFELLRQNFGGGSSCDKYKYISNLNKKYGPVVKLWIKPFAPVIMVADVDYFDKILMSKEHLIKSKMYDLIKPYLGEGLATTNKIDMWKRDRKICNVAFNHNTVTGFSTIFARHTERFLESLKKQTGKVLDAQHLLHLYTLDTVFESIAKQEQNFQENATSSYLDARVNFFKVVAERLYSPFLANDFFFKFSNYYKVMKNALHIIRDYTQDIIQSEEKKREKGDYINSKLNLIDILFSNNIQTDALNDQINTFILAGHDTVAQAMSFTLLELSKHQAIQQKVFDEVVSIVGKDKNAEITNNDLQQMKYLESVAKESLRLYAVVPIIERRLTEDINIHGINYPKGTQFAFHLQGAHDSERYFKNANKFDPDRFLPENAHLIQRNSYAPFSMGPRDCIGRLYAMLELKFFLAKFVQKFQVLPVENHELRMINEIIIKSASGIPVICEERK